MGRPTGPLTHCDGTWTESKYINFIKNQLRSGSRKWSPIQKCKSRARVERGLYRCESCGEVVAPTIFDEDKAKRVNNIFVDHIIPIVDPAVGFTNFDDFAKRLYCNSDNLQLLCGACHKVKSQEEIDVATARRQKEKNE